ncbi:hypothetical protein K438DRAFT_2077839 [Mycena galopus ATCC 62051]|nr:hypothetical protein K438DRAFT_2077839 [Mycena galopus ATCC 62051]
MGDAKSASARRKSKGIANSVPDSTVQRPNTQQPSSPESTAVSGSNYDLSAGIDFSGAPNSETPLFLDQQDDDRSSSINITPPPPIKRKAPSKAASKKMTSDHESEVTLSSNSEEDVVQPPKKKSRGKKAKGGETETLSHDKRPATSLITDEDWKGCLEDVRQAESGKKASVLIPVMILVTEQYLNSLSAKRGKAKPSIGKGRSKKPVILDLDHAESGDDDFDDGLGTRDPNYILLKSFSAGIQVLLEHFNYI